MRDKLATADLKIPPGSRLARFEHLNARYAAKEIGFPGRGSRRDLDHLIEGSRDFAEFASIIEFTLPADDRVVREKLRLAFGGRPNPRCDTNSNTRDTQFELY